MQTADRSGPIIEPGTKVGTVDRAGHLGAVKQRVRARSTSMAVALKSRITARRGGGELPTALTLERAFREFDEDGNGTLELRELLFGMRRLGVDVDDEALQSMFSVLDSDGDGHVQYAEFAQWFGAGPPPAPPPLEAHAHAEQIAAAGGAMGGELQQEIEIAAVQKEHKSFLQSIERPGGKLKPVPATRDKSAPVLGGAGVKYNISESADPRGEVLKVVQHFPEAISYMETVSDLPCNVRREGGQSLVIGGSSLVILEGKACNPLCNPSLRRLGARPAPPARHTCWRGSKAGARWASRNSRRAGT